jgi:hypothetical protein
MSYEERRKAAYSLIPQKGWLAAQFFREFLTSFCALGRIASMSCEERRKAAYSLIPQDTWQAAKFFREFWENYLTSLCVLSRIVTMNREERRKAAYSLIPQKVWYNVLLMQNKFPPPPPCIAKSFIFVLLLYIWLPHRLVKQLVLSCFQDTFTGVLYAYWHGISVYRGHRRRGVSFRQCEVTAPV